VENRLPVLRSVNTGISCLIDSTGRIRDSYRAASEGFPTDAMQRTGMAGWFMDRMPIDTRVTFFSRHGQWLDTTCAIAFVVVLVGPLVARKARRTTGGLAKSK
jgi:apolipoprotein N-acyltransferase